MNETILKKNVFILFLIIIGNGCKKENVYTPDPDPAIAILGKWRIIEMGNSADMFPVNKTLEYVEFLTDSVKNEYDSKTGQLCSIKKYWIDTLYHEGSRREDGYLLSFEYTYQFKEDIFILETFNAPSIFNKYVLQKIK